MAKKANAKSLLVLGAIGAGIWWLLSGSAFAATAPALGQAAQGYLNQIMAAQNQLLNGAISQAVYTGQAGAILFAASMDSKVSTSEINYLHGVAGL